MSEHKKLRSFESVLRARGLMEKAAAQAVVDAVLREDEGRAEVKAGEAALSAALADWQSCLDARTFDPETLSGRAAVLNARDTELEAAISRHQDATRRTQEARSHHAACQARTSQTEEALQRLRRKVRRQNEEHRLTAMEDRIAYHWVQR